jgi:hypothetical protein
MPAKLKIQCGRNHYYCIYTRIIARNIIFVLKYHRHKVLELRSEVFTVVKIHILRYETMWSDG